MKWLKGLIAGIVVYFVSRHDYGLALAMLAAFMFSAED